MTNKNEIVAIIPARGGSKSIPKKNIIDFCGKPLIAWSIEHALKSKFITEVYVSTDDKDTGDVCRKYGAKIIWRPDELATDTSSCEEALSHAISEIEKDKSIDIVIFLQATSPLRETKDIDNAIEKFLSEGADSLFSAAILEDFCIWGFRDDGLESITYDYKNRGFRQDREPLYLENGSIYVFKPEILEKHNNRLGGKIAMYFMEYWKSFEIDKIEDIEICEYFMKKKLFKDTAINIEDIDLMVYDFDGIMTDNKVITFENGKEAIVANRANGLAVSMLKKMRIPQIILSTETNKVVEARAKKIGIPVLYNLDDKKEMLIKYCRKNGYKLKKVVYCGNDINDLEAMKIVGYPIAPSDAVEEVKDSAVLVLEIKGGDGVIKEFVSKYINF